MTVERIVVGVAILVAVSFIVAVGALTYIFEAIIQALP